MVKIGLQIKAYFQNIEQLKTCHDFSYYFKLKCSSCGEISDKWQDINISNVVETARSKTNYLAKCKLCSRENSMDIIADSYGVYTSDNEGSFKTIVVFDCRGIEPIEFDPRDGWEARATSGKLFEDVNLSDSLWADYDDISNDSVEINEFNWKIIKVK